MMTGHDQSRDVLDALCLLPPRDCRPDRSRVILSVALAALASNRPAAISWQITLERVYCRFVEPVWVAILGAAFLLLAFSRAAAVLR
jgi:hypothetical protein